MMMLSTYMYIQIPTHDVRGIHYMIGVGVQLAGGGSTVLTSQYAHSANNACTTHIHTQ